MWSPTAGNMSEVSYSSFLSTSIADEYTWDPTTWSSCRGLLCWRGRGIIGKGGASGFSALKNNCWIWICNAPLTLSWRLFMRLAQCSKKRPSGDDSSKLFFVSYISCCFFLKSSYMQAIKSLLSFLFGAFFTDLTSLSSFLSSFLQKIQVLSNRRILPINRVQLSSWKTNGELHR